MKQGILSRIKALEERAGVEKTLSYEEWVNSWGGVDELSKALYIEEAENEEFLLMMNQTDKDRERAYLRRSYLQRMGVVKNEH